MKKIIKTALLALLAVFILLNLLWFGWRHMTYAGFAEGMTRTEVSSFLFPTFASKDEDSFDYTVKYPDYLSLLAIWRWASRGPRRTPLPTG